MRLRALGLLLVGILLGAGLVAFDEGGSATAPRPPQISGAAAADDSPTVKANQSGVPGETEAPARGTPASEVAAAAPEPTSVPEPPPIPAALVARLNEQLASPELRVQGNLGVSVLDGHGRTLLDRSASQALTPASTQKLLTAATALHILGPDYRYVTRVYATAAPDDAGVVNGNLVVLGAGDPALASPTYHEQVYPARPHTSLADLADRIAASGIRRVRRVVGDPSVFADQPQPRGWLDRYFNQLDATYVSGLTVDGSRRLLRRGDALLADVARDPAQVTAAVLTELLEERGVKVNKPPISLRDSKPLTVEVARVESPPLTELLRHTVQRSDNHMADGIYRTLGAVTGQPTWTGSARAVRAAVERRGVVWGGARVFDGSGLSRRDRLPAALLTGLDHAMSSSDLGSEWSTLMAVAGERGTLRSRLTGTPADGRLYGKTGTLADVRALAGSVTGPGERRYHLAVVGSDLTGGEDIVAVRRLTDVLAMTLAADLYGCDQPVYVPPASSPEPSETGTPRPAPEPPEAFVCPAA